jgi:hypothetical protein
MAWQRWQKETLPDTKFEAAQIKIKSIPGGQFDGQTQIDVSAGFAFDYIDVDFRCIRIIRDRRTRL